MIIVLDDREVVSRAYLAGLDRLGIAGTVFELDEFRGWFGAVEAQDVLAIEAFLVGTGKERTGLIRQIRGRSPAPIIALNDLRILDETLELFSAGVDDVVCKPVHVREILARVRAIQSRSRQRSTIEESADIIFFSDGRDPVVAGEVLALPRRELRILECLVKNRNAWVSKRQIFNQVYGIFNDDVDENVIESHVSRLRKRLRQRLGRDPIETQRFLGYRLAERVAGDAVRTTNDAASFAQGVRGEFVA